MNDMEPDPHSDCQFNDERCICPDCEEEANIVTYDDGLDGESFVIKETACCGAQL